MELQNKLKPNNRTSIISTGQAGYIIKSKSGQLLGIDLYLSDYVEKLEGNIGYKRLLPKLINPKDIKLDVLIATHSHGDHYDKDSMEGLMANDKTVLFTSVDCEEIVGQQGISKDKVFYKKPGEEVKIKDFKVNFVDCDHGEGAPDAFGVVVQVDGKIIYEVGDSCLRIDYANNIKERFPRVDVLIGPINGAYGNMNEEEFAIFVDVIKPEIAIPCHYGMFASHGGNPGKFYEIIKAKYSNQKICLMTQGEELFL